MREDRLECRGFWRERERGREYEPSPNNTLKISVRQGCGREKNYKKKPNKTGQGGCWWWWFSCPCKTLTRTNTRLNRHTITIPVMILTCSVWWSAKDPLPHYSPPPSTNAPDDNKISTKRYKRTVLLATQKKRKCFPKSDKRDTRNKDDHNKSRKKTKQ